MLRFMRVFNRKEKEEEKESVRYFQLLKPDPN